MPTGTSARKDGAGRSPAGEPWFVAKDVCDALGMPTEKTGTGRWLAGLERNERNTIRNSDGAGGMPPNTAIISESGLYSLILKSRKPEAQRFRMWVTSMVSSA